MSDQDVSKEVTRLRHLLLKMAELAEHVEQTGSFQSGLQNSITRYNTIVLRLEQIGASPPGLFPALDSDASTGTLGAEATLLAEYLEDFTKEERSSERLPGLETIVSLAPFLGRDELSSMVRAQFPSGRKHVRRREGQCGSDDEEEAEGERSRPDMRTLVHLAPHLDSADLGELVRAYLASESSFDPKFLVHLAPHMKSKDLSAIMREHMADWFKPEADEPSEPAKQEPQPAPAPQPAPMPQPAPTPAPFAAARVVPTVSETAFAPHVGHLDEEDAEREEG